jgi:hypothetical protein
MTLNTRRLSRSSETKPPSFVHFLSTAYTSKLASTAFNLPTEKLAFA